uniref:Uncharacterized protein n=1 Tax=Romanomermis culicivorax TaxID=13658 RepID=A0A915KKI8_ROMCU
TPTIRPKKQRPHNTRRVKVENGDFEESDEDGDFKKSDANGDLQRPDKIG